MTTLNTTGTITVTNGSAAIVGVGTNWAAAGIAGGTLFVGGASYPIASVASNTSLTLAIPFVGTSGSGKAYAIAVEQAVLETTTANANRLAEILVGLAPIASFTTFSTGLMTGINQAAWRTGLGLGSLATLSSVNNANWSGTDLSVANGGTGASSFTADCLLKGNGAGAVGVSSVYDSGGNVGINISVPSAPLHINDTASYLAGLGSLKFGASGQTSRAWLVGMRPPGNFAVLDSIGSSERFTIDTTGNVGIGTTSPAEKLDVAGKGRFQLIEAYSTSAAINIRHGSAGNLATPLANFYSSYTTRLGYFGFPSTGHSDLYITADSGAVVFQVGGAARAKISTSGDFQLNAYGAGTLTTDASGNVTSSSDERLKIDIEAFNRGLDDVLGITPISYRWSAASGLDQMTVYSGFSAQNVEAAIPEAIGVGADGYLSVDLRPLVAALVNAAKTLKSKNDELAARVAALEV